MMELGTFRKSQKFIPSKKNQSDVIAEISSRKTQKITNPQKYTPPKISCHTVLKGLEKLPGPVVKLFSLYSDRHLSSRTNIKV